MDAVGEGRAAVAIGRESELARIETFLASGDAPPRTLLLAGEPGIGKTTLWKEGIARARARGLRVLQARPTEPEARLGHAALIDLLEDVGTEELSELPSPQRRALEVVTLRADSTARAQAPGAIGVGFLNALRTLSRSRPLLVAVDDIQWLDAASADALAFAARRVDDEAIAFLVAKRADETLALERALETGGIGRLDVSPLSIGATRRLLSARLGLVLPRRLLRHLYSSADGNPMFALELGRTLVARGLPEIGEGIPFSGKLEEVVGARVTGLSRAARRALLAIALSPDLRAPQIESLAGGEAVAEAAGAGIIVFEGERVRPGHPLLAAAALHHSRPGEHAAMHATLATIASDRVRRARHLACASTSPDRDVAILVAEAADVADTRGARHESVELAEHALRLTPASAPERDDRLLVLAEYLARAGERERVTSLLEPELATVSSGKARALAWVLLADARGGWTEEDSRDLDHALVESDGDLGVRAMVFARRANNAAAVRVRELSAAETWALEALEAAPHAGPDTEQLALYALAWARSFRGVPIDDLVERASSRGDVVHLRRSLERVVCDRLAWRGELSQARAIVRSLLQLAEEHGESRSYFALLSQLCEIELRAGDLDLASQLLDEWEQSSDRFVAPVYERCRLLVSVYRGLPAEIDRWLPDVIVRSETLESGWDLLEGLRARGVAALFAHEHELAAASLRSVWQYTMQEGIEDPGAFPVAPDFVESLVELGAMDEAQAVATRLRELAVRQQHPWGIASANRCSGLIRLAAPTYDERAATELAEAAAGYGERGLRFDRARSLLSLGRGQRRLRKWKAARASLEQAAAAFDEIGSTGWADAARSELARVGARKPRPEGELTGAERQVVELAIEGLANKEIARRLVVTVPTVEKHLSHAYTKLGVRSRTQLAHRVGRGQDG